jgi:hypothetical protein|tara:strand:+ start:1326 stop:1724 length:399 start_codon:yes stop_codon:yes gene_type:complete
MEESNLSAEKLTKAYIKIREERASLSASFKEKDTALVNQLDMVRKGLLDYCDTHKVESVKTSEGLFYRTTKTKYWTSDWESMHKFILEHGVPELFDKRLNQSNLKEFLEDNPDVYPEGLNKDTEYAITVRKK